MKYGSGLKIVFLLFIYFFSASVVFAAPTIYFNNPPKQLNVGDRMTLDVSVRSEQQAINAVSGAISYPEGLLGVVGFSQDNSAINFWTASPRSVRGKISFEGIILNPGYQGSGTTVFRVILEAKKEGTAYLNVSEGALLANDGQGTNILTTLGSAKVSILPSSLFGKPIVNELPTSVGSRLAALPVITEYSQLTESKNNIFLKGKGEPGAITKIIFKDVAVKSLGEKLIALLQTKKKNLEPVLVENNPSGMFEYVSGKNLVAGVYNATPFLVDEKENTEKAGLGVQLLVSDSKIVKGLVVLINVLGLLIPVVGLAVLVYFIPWYSFRRMRVIKKRLGLEEEKLEMTGHQMERQDKIMDNNLDKPAQ